MTRITSVFLVFAVACCATDAYDTSSDTITGTCVYTASDGAEWCVNRWGGDAGCEAADSGETAGTWSAGGSCEARGFPYPCTYDMPSSAWVVEAAACETWGL